MSEQRAITTTTTGSGALAIAPDAAQRLDAAADATRFLRFNMTKAESTLRAYHRDLKLFVRAAHNLPADADGIDAAAEALRTDPAAWHGITHGIVEAFQLWLLQQGYALSSINRALYAVRTYARLAMLSGVIDAEQYAKIEDVKAPTTAKAVANIDDKRNATRRADIGEGTRKKSRRRELTDDEARRLWISHDLATHAGLRDAVLFGLLLELGLRASELAALTFGQINLETRRVRIVRKKTANESIFQLSQALRSVLRRWLTARDIADPGATVLCGVTRGDKITGKPMSAANISMRVKAVAAALGIDGLSAHDLRHHAMHYYRDAGADALTLQELGGWKDTRMVRRYTEGGRIANDALPSPLG